MDLETLRGIMSRPVCPPCLDTVADSAKETGEDYQDAERVYKWACDFGDQISPGDHGCAEEDDEDVDCYCGCQRGGSVVSFNEFTTQGPVCESCVEFVQDCAMVLSLASDGIMHTYMYTRTTGGDLGEHECEAEDDGEVECHCSCAASASCLLRFLRRRIRAGRHSGTILLPGVCGGGLGLGYDCPIGPLADAGNI